MFALADEGRLKPIYSTELIALSRQTDSQGGHSYDVEAHHPVETDRGWQSAGQVRIRKEFADHAMIRILLRLTVDGQRQQFAAYYDIPLRKYLNRAPAAASRRPPRSAAAPPAPKVTK